MKRSRLLLWGVALAAGLLTAPAIALPVAPAQAVNSITVVSANSASNSLTTKTITVDCPLGTSLYGPGGGITGGGGNVALEAVVPEGNPPFRARVTARELGAFTGNWSVSAWASCGPFTNNLQVVPGNRASSTATTKEIDARCESAGAGLRLYGTGFRVNGGVGNVLVHDVIPGTSISPRSVTVRATARPGFTPNWGLDAFAVCATAAPTMGIEQASTTSTSSSSKGINSQNCPTGTFAHGVGSQTSAPAPNTTAVDGRIALTTTAALFTALGSAAAAENGTVSDNWRLQVYVVCSN